MCGRYLIEDEAYADILQILNDIKAAKDRIFTDNIPADGFMRGEVFPTNIAPVVENSNSDICEIVAVKWGFPHWKNPSVIINARSETALEKRMFGKPLRERRCVIPSSGFYEWSHSGDPQQGRSWHTGSRQSSAMYGNTGRSSKRKAKEKFLFRRPEERMLYMAGMIGTFHDAFGVEYNAFTILTTAANESVSPIHDRMPVILGADEVDLWITDNGFMEFVLHRPGPELVTIPDVGHGQQDNVQLSL